MGSTTKRKKLTSGGHKKSAGNAGPSAGSEHSVVNPGLEGINKTNPVPKPDGAPSEELGSNHGKHVENSPSTRG